VAGISSYSPSKALRASLFVGTPVRSLAHASVPWFAFVLVFLAVLLSFTISGNTLNVLGTHYAEQGGNPLVKIHPATYLAFIAAVASLVSGSAAQSRLGYVFGKAPALFFFLGFTIFCSIFSAVNVGITGVGVYVDNYLSAGALAIAMSSANRRQRQIIAHLILVLCAVNVLISLVEYVDQRHLIPLDMNLDNESVATFDENTEEFRPAALYTHPLTGAMATAFGLFLALETRLRFRTAAFCFGIFMVGLLSFGGRAALGITITLIVVRVAITFTRDFLNGRINGRLLGTVLLAVCLLGPLTAYLLTATPVGERIAAKAYYDESAEVRSDQWQVLNKITTQQALYGTPAVDLPLIYEQVGIRGVENPIILIVLNLGIIGSPILLLGLAIYFLYLRQAYPESGWLLLAAAFIFFSSNSIGVKTPDLFMMTACAVTMKRQLDDRSDRDRKRHAFRLPFVSPHRESRGLGDDPSVGGAIMSLRRAARQLSPYVVKKPGPAPGPKQPTPIAGPSSPATSISIGKTVSILLTPTSGGTILDAAGDIWTLTAEGDVLKNGQPVSGGGDIVALTYSNSTILGKDGATSQWYVYSDGTWHGPIAVPPAADS
jgi:hypothetical protein